MSDLHGDQVSGLSLRQRTAKRMFDLVIAGTATLLTWPIIVVATVVASVDTSQWGIFTQERIGRNGARIRVHKIRTMRDDIRNTSTVTTSVDPRITRIGGLMRKTKIDELPQFIDVLVGTMSIVGPRPDVPGWADLLQGQERVILTLRPGITGPASLAYRDEESLLAAADDPIDFNRSVIWPDKVRINSEYVAEWSFVSDVKFVLATFFSIATRTRRNPSHFDDRSSGEAR